MNCGGIENCSFIFDWGCSTFMNNASKTEFVSLCFIPNLATCLDGHLNKFLGFLDFWCTKVYQIPAFRNVLILVDIVSTLPPVNIIFVIFSAPVHTDAIRTLPNRLMLMQICMCRDARAVMHVGITNPRWRGKPISSQRYLWPIWVIFGVDFSHAPLFILIYIDFF